VVSDLVPTIELCIVASRRSDLLARTLDSFNSRLFHHFRFARVSVNIDPIWGDLSEAERCAEAVRRHFPDADIFQPDVPSYAGAVKRLWERTRSDYIFHLEDDWDLAESVTPDILRLFDLPRVKQIALKSKEKPWKFWRRGAYHYRRGKIRLLGRIWTPFERREPAFTVSPNFIDGPFARLWADMMDVTLDPEKQVSRKGNQALAATASPFRVYLYRGKQVRDLIVDTGRPWREARSIVKAAIDGKPVWLTQPAGQAARSPETPLAIRKA
jgi:hypothetical protein